MTEKQKQWIVWGVLVVLIAVAGFLGITFPISAPPAPEAAQQQSLSPDAFTRFGSVEVNQLRVKNNEEHSGTEEHTGAATFGTLTATTLISHSVGFSATTTSTLVDVTARNITTTGGIVVPAGGITQGGVVFTATSPLTISGVLTNVRLLYYQVP